jgi:hypothetical protein
MLIKLECVTALIRFKLNETDSNRVSLIKLTI